MTDHGRREIDVVVHGATGYTGQLVSKYFAETVEKYLEERFGGKSFTWAISGRSIGKLEDVAKACQEASPRKRKPLVLVADSMNNEQMLKLASRTRVVIACAGPFAKFGMPLVAACVAAQTHYVDITGEFPFVREMIEKYHDEAVAKGVLLMPCSGFDSVPSDLGNAYAHNMAKDAGLQLNHVEGAFQVKGGGASRGTLESILNIVNALGRQDMHPLSLVAKDRREGVATPKTRFPRFHTAMQRYVGPFFMADTNERVVRRSNSLAGAFRRNASYVEMIRGGLVQVTVMWLMTFAMMLLFVPGLKQLFQRFVFPAPGQGPKGDGMFQAFFLGYVSQAATKPAVEAQITCTVEPYKFTAISAAEVAMALVNNEVDEGVVGGVVPAGAALSRKLVDRLMLSGKVTFTCSR